MIGRDFFPDVARRMALRYARARAAALALLRDPLADPASLPWARHVARQTDRRSCASLPPTNRR